MTASILGLHRKVFHGSQSRVYFCDRRPKEKRKEKRNKGGERLGANVSWKSTSGGSSPCARIISHRHMNTFKKKKKKKKISIKVPQNKFDYSFFSKEPKPNYMFSSLHKYGQTDQAKRRYFTLLSSILTLPVLEEEVQEHVPSCQSCALQPDCTSPTDQSTSRQGREFQGRPP